jgi:hypothetical protein
MNEPWTCKKHYKKSKSQPHRAKVDTFDVHLMNGIKKI